MRSLFVAEPNLPPVLGTNAPQPRPGRGELLIRVCAAGVTPSELSWYPTTHRQSGEIRACAVPGHEFSGVVAATGEDVDPRETGAEVFGMNDWYAEGAMADFCIAPSFAVAPKPRRLSHVEAASVPIAALTAWQALFDHAALQAGERILVHGAAGGVGIFAVQLASLHGAHTIATASADNAGFLLGLGAERVIDYRSSRFEDSVRDLDVVFDTVGGDTLERSWSVLKPGGRMVTIASSTEGSTDPRAASAFFIVKPDRKQLVQIADLLDAGRLRTVVDAVVPLSRAADAFAGKAPGQHRGKVVVAVAAMEETKEEAI